MRPASLRRLRTRVLAGAAIGLMTAAALAAPAAAEDAIHPFIHSELTVSDVVSGGTVEVSPTFLQQDGLGSATVALVANFTSSYLGVSRVGDGADPEAPYDNCVRSPETEPRRSVSCVITDFTDRPGTALTFTEPVTYTLSLGAVGPLETCGCPYSVRAVDQAALDAEFPDLNWDPDSENLMGVTTADSWEAPEDPESVRESADITLITAANPIDLEIGEAAFAGAVGDESAANIFVTNNGPAVAFNRAVEYGSYAVRAELPEGVELTSIPSDGNGDWSCLDEASLADEYARTTTQLDHYDLYCYFLTPISVGEQAKLTLTGLITAEEGTAGRVEVATLYTDANGNALDPDLSDNLASLGNVRERAPLPANDFTGDGVADLAAFPTTSGNFYLYPGDGSGGFLSRLYVWVFGFTKMDSVMAGDTTGDGFSDVIARDNVTGNLYTYPGDGAGGFSVRFQVGSGWNAMGAFTVLDHDGDSIPDLLGVRKADGGLFYHPGVGDGTFGGRVLVDTGFNSIDMLTAPGDVDRDGREDLLVRLGRTQEYRLILSGSEEPLTFDPWLGDSTQSLRYRQVAGVGDLDGDDVADLVAVDSRTGALYRQSIAASGSLEGFTALDGTDLHWFRLPTVMAQRAYDYNMDGGGDIIARRDSDDTTFLYSGDGAGGFDGRTSWGTEFSGMNLLETAGDFTGDSVPDLIGRVAASGWLYVYPGDGSGGYDAAARVRIGTGWNTMRDIVSGQDFNGDGMTDIVARERSSSYLYLYPGKGDGKVGTRVGIGKNFDSYRSITSVGDLDHNGRADLIAVRSSDNCLYFFSRNSAGQFSGDREKKLGCGWGAMDRLTAVGDFDNDGHNDFAARRKSDGALLLYKGNGMGGFASPIVIGTGWNTMDLIA